MDGWRWGCPALGGLAVAMATLSLLRSWWWEKGGEVHPPAEEVNPAGLPWRQEVVVVGGGDEGEEVGPHRASWASLPPSVGLMSPGLSA